MPAARLTLTPLEGTRYCVLGICRRPKGHGSAHKIDHVGLLSPPRDPAAGGADANFSLLYGGRNPCDHVVAVDGINISLSLNSPPIGGIVVLGYLGDKSDEPLSDEDANKIEAFIQFTANQKVTYICHPTFRNIEIDSGKTVPQFSCVGFVLRCYLEIGIQLLADVEMHSDKITHNLLYPRLSLKELRSLWPEISRLENAGLLSTIGLSAIKGDRWPIILPGYVFKALKNYPGAAPYQPRDIDDASF